MKIGRKIFVLSSLLISFLLVSCDDTYISSIPDFPVWLQLNLTSTYPTFRNSYNKSLTFENPIIETDRVGYGGILVYTGFDGQYYAFDMSCPYEHKAKIKVRPNELGQAICDSCKSVYDIGYGIGNPSSGKSKEVLRRYKANLSGDILSIAR
jgi:hypothetical protein